MATIFTNALAILLASYSYSDNGALWTGTAMNGWVHEYLAAIRENNSTLEQNALITIRKLISGMAMEIIVPNGGLGSNYSGILSRGWAGPDDRAIAPRFFTNASEMANGNGIIHNIAGLEIHPMMNMEDIIWA